MRDFQQQRNNTFFTLLSLPATAMGFALCVQIAALSWILNTQYGFNLHEIGIVWAAGPLAGIIGQLLIGVISDNVWFWNGRRRPFILIGGGIAALMLLALPNLNLIQQGLGIKNLLGIAIAVALTLDLAINISFNPTRSIIADVTPEGTERTKGFTWMQSISGFFGVIAYLIGAFIDNYTLIYLGVFIVFFFSIIPPFYIEEPRELHAEKADSSQAENKSQSTNWPEFLKICFAHAFTWIGVQTMFVYSFSYIKEVIMGYQTMETLTDELANEIGFITGIAFAILNTVGFLLPALVLQPLSERIGRVRTHQICIAIMAIGYANLYLAGQSVTSFVLIMIIIGIGWAAVVSLVFAIVSETVDQSRMGFYMGLFNLSVVLPQLIASSLGSFFEQQPDKSVIYIVCAVCLGISALLWFSVKEQSGEVKESALSGGGH